MRITIIIVTLMIPSIVSFFMALIRYFSDKSGRKMTYGSFEIRLHWSLSLLGVVGFLVLGGLFIVAIMQDNGYQGTFWTVRQVVAYVIVSILLCLCVILILGPLMRKIVVRGSEITIFYAFKRPCSFSFDDIVCAQKKVIGQSEKIIVKTSFGKKFAVENMEISYDLFIKALKNKVNRQYLRGL